MKEAILTAEVEAIRDGESKRITLKCDGVTIIAKLDLAQQMYFTRLIMGNLHKNAVPCQIDVQ